MRRRSSREVWLSVVEVGSLGSGSCQAGGGEERGRVGSTGRRPAWTMWVEREGTEENEEGAWWERRESELRSREGRVERKGEKEGRDASRKKERGTHDAEPKATRASTCNPPSSSTYTTPHHEGVEKKKKKISPRLIVPSSTARTRRSSLSPPLPSLPRAFPPFPRSRSIKTHLAISKCSPCHLNFSPSIGRYPAFFLA